MSSTLHGAVTRPTLRERWPVWIGGVARESADSIDVHDVYTGEPVARVATADDAAIEEAIDAADRAAPILAALPAWRRRDACLGVVRRLAERREELATVIAIECGKPIPDARNEVARAIEVFTLAAEEATRIEGSWLPLDRSPRSERQRGIVRRVAAGPVLLYSAFNFPLNLAAHKVAPALAAGCPFVLKPSPRTPLATLILAEILGELDLPSGAFSVLCCGNEAAGRLVADPRFRVFSFTGSPDVGWALRARSTRARVVLELGGNAACIVDEGTDLDHAAQRIVAGAYSQAGQSCISVQRVLAHDSIAAPLRDRIAAGAAALRPGDPLDEATTLGPLIDLAAAERVEAWIAEAVAAGGTIVAGGARSGSFVEATLVEGLPGAAPVAQREVFGPVATIESFSDFDDALVRADAGPFGLQAGIFTRDIDRAFRAFDRLRVGGVVVGDVPSTRADAMPYGGVADSGLGREGPRSAIEDFTELRTMLLVGVG